MSLNPLAPAFLPHYQSPSDLPVPLCNFTAMSLPLAQLFCELPSQTNPSQAPSINQHITGGILLLPPLQYTNQSEPDAAASPPTPGSSSSLSSPLQHQAKCLQVIHKTIQQFNQHLKAELLDRQTLHFIVFQLQNDFALLRCLLFSNKDKAIKSSATSPFLTLTLTLTITLRHVPSHFPPLVNHAVVGLPRWALWDHPERKQTILQKLISSQHAGSPCNHGAEPHIMNLETRKFICRWNSNLCNFHCGDSFSTLFLIW